MTMVFLGSTWSNVWDEYSLNSGIRFCVTTHGPIMVCTAGKLMAGVLLHV